MDSVSKSKIIDILNTYSREAVPSEVIKKMAMELGFESAAHSIENAEKVCKQNTVKPSELPGDFDTEFAKAALLKEIKAKAIFAMVENSDKDLYTSMRDKLNEYNELSMKAVQQYESEIDTVLTDLKTMLVASGKDTKILDEVLNTKLGVL